MKGNASCHAYTAQGRENHERIFGKLTDDQSACVNGKCKKHDKCLRYHYREDKIRWYTNFPTVDNCEHFIEMPND